MLRHGTTDVSQIPFGFNDNSVAQGVATAPQAALLASEAGANVERITVDWRWAESQPGNYQLGMYDAIYNSLIARGIRPLWIPLFAPSWALSATTPCNQWATDCRFPPAPEHYADYARFAALLAWRYPQSAGIEVWNEENLSYFWEPAPDALAYSQLLATTYSKVKTVRPTMPVVVGGVSDTETTANANVPISGWLTALYLNGLASHTDAISVHPYPGPGVYLPQVDTAMKQTRLVRAAFNDTARPIWVTEIGVTTDGGLITNAQQASDLSWIYKDLTSQPDVKLLEVHTLVTPKNTSVSEAGYGLVNSALQPLSGFCTLASLRGSSFSCSS